MPPRTLLIATCTALLALIGCTSTDSSGITSPASTDAGDAAVSRPRPIDRGEVTGTITEGNGPSPATPADLSEHGYIEEEFLLEGDAVAYAAEGELGIDGVWNAVPDNSSHYATRLIVRRPSHAGAFNGTVLVEWLNVTGGVDATVGYILAREELLREGYGYVGVSVQKAGVDALRDADSSRYGSLTHPGDAYGYDIFAR